MNLVVREIRSELLKKADPIRARHSLRYFQPEVGDTDNFIGVRVPEQRAIVRKYYQKLSPKDVLELLNSEIHEERLTALLIWVSQFKKAELKVQQEIVELYIRNTKWINNWDLVDSSAHYILGAWAYDKDKSILDKLSYSKNVWERRIAIIATSYFIMHNQFDWSLTLAERYLKDTHHYIHKASGWMLRELGKRDIDVLYSFLDQHATQMPRTMLRYSIEKLPPSKRKYYLSLK